MCGRTLGPPSVVESPVDGGTVQVHGVLKDAGPPVCIRPRLERERRAELVKPPRLRGLFFKGTRFRNANEWTPLRHDLVDRRVAGRRDHDIRCGDQVERIVEPSDMPHPLAGRPPSMTHNRPIPPVGAVRRIPHLSEIPSLTAGTTQNEDPASARLGIPIRLCKRSPVVPGHSAGVHRLRAHCGAHRWLLERWMKRGKQTDGAIVGEEMCGIVSSTVLADGHDRQTAQPCEGGHLGRNIHDHQSRRIIRRPLSHYRHPLGQSRATHG